MTALAADPIASGIAIHAAVEDHAQADAAPSAEPLFARREGVHVVVDHNGRPIRICSSSAN